MYRVDAVSLGVHDKGSYNALAQELQLDLETAWARLVRLA